MLLKSSAQASGARYRTERRACLSLITRSIAAFSLP
jgi:hypothetical protein